MSGLANGALDSSRALEAVAELEVCRLDRHCLEQLLVLLDALVQLLDSLGICLDGLEHFLLCLAELFEHLGFHLGVLAASGHRDDLEQLEGNSTTIISSSSSQNTCIEICRVCSFLHGFA